MNTYLCPQAITIPVSIQDIRRSTLLLLFTLLTFFIAKAQTNQELIFRTSTIESGDAGKDGTIYRFPNVRVGGSKNVDALVKINTRSSSLVKLLSIDMPSQGHDKAFQPQVTYNNNSTPSGVSDWWMEFQISFVENGTTIPVIVDSFRITSLDIDGNGDKLNEHVSFYNIKSYLLEQNSSLTAENISELVNGVSTVVGRKFNGPVANYTNIDTAATAVMVTTLYQNTNSFKLRVGGHSTGSTSAADRMYSFWFRQFNYQAPAESMLPLSLLDFSARLQSSNVSLNWITGMEKAFSHFVVERSVNGVEYREVGMIFANGNSNVKQNYAFTDAINTKAKGVVYYRLKMVDQNGSYQRSQIRLIRVGEETQTMAISTYPNPVSSEIRITIPAQWQNSQVTYDVYAAGGQLVKHVVRSNSSQTEMINVSDLTNGMYIVKASNGNSSATQRIVKSK